MTANIRKGEIIGIIVLALVALAIIIWGSLVHTLVGDQPREWNYGTRPYVPAETHESSAPSPSGTANVPAQVELPPQPEEPAQ